MDMTKVSDSDKDASVATGEPEATGAPEITQEMEVAGKAVLLDSGYVDSGPQSGIGLLARQVFSAMWAHRPR